MSFRWRLFSVGDPFDTENTNELFLAAARENCRFHYEHCPEYRAILDGLGFAPDMLREYRDLERLPFLPTLLFKHHKLFSLPKWRMLSRATSSGTKGVFSEIGYEASGLLCALKMTLKIAPTRGLLSATPCHYIVFGYKHHRGNRTAVTKTAFGTTLLAPALSRTYALKFSGGAYAPDLEGVIDAFVRHSRSRFPLRTIGFPSYTYFALRLMDERGIRLRLPEGSKLMLGGGWKQFYTEQVDKPTLYALAERVLGVSDKNIVEFFGAVEHPILYCDCENHRFHVPAYSRVIIRDVNTLAPLPHGQVGLVELLTPLIKASPILGVMTDDLGVLHDGAECGCGCASPYLEIIGRVGLRDIKTCAAGAADYLKGAGL